MRLKLLLILPVISFGQIPFYHSDDVTGDGFGSAIAVSGNEAIVSTTYTAFPLSDVSGQTVLYTLSADDVTQTHVFSQTDGQANDGFGEFVDFEGNHVIITSPNHQMQGAVYTFFRENGQWEFGQKIMQPEMPGPDNFGRICLEGEYLFISALTDEEQGLPSTTDSGAIYVYHFDGIAWIYEQKLTVEGSRFLGTRMDVGGWRMVAEGKDENDNSRIYSFELVGDSWQYITQTDDYPNLGGFDVVGDDFYFTNLSGNVVQTIAKINLAAGWEAETLFAVPSSDQVFGAIKVLGDRIFVGSTWYILQMPRKFPLLYYRNIGGEWLYQNTFYSNAPEGVDDYFGSVLSGDGDNLVIGSPREGQVSANGMAYYLNTALLASANHEISATSVYPNPAQDYITIAPGNSEILFTTLYDITGKITRSQKSESTIDIADLQSGIYMLRIVFADGKTEAVKIVKD